jgi:hypothetical protein
MTLFFVILSHYLVGYEFTHQFPEDDNVQLDLFFSATGMNLAKIQNIVLSDLYYTIAYQEVFEGNSYVDMIPHVMQISHTSRVDYPYKFRLSKVTKSEYSGVKTFWQKLLDLSKMGPTKEEIESAKEKLKRMIDRLQEHVKNVQSFIKRYQSILDEVTEDRIHNNFQQIWVFNDLHLDYKVNPLSMTIADSDQNLKIFFAGNGEPFSAEISESDKEHIYEIIHTMGTNGLFSLLRKKSHLQSLGKKIHHVQPLQLLSYVMTNSTLKHDMKEVQKNPFKWINFIDGLSKPILKQWKEGSLQSQLPGFAKLVGKNPYDLQHCLEKGKVEDFVNELIR